MKKKTFKNFCDIVKKKYKFKDLTVMWCNQLQSIKSCNQLHLEYSIFVSFLKYFFEI